MTELEAILQNCLAEVLGIDPDRISPSATFADQGLDSLLGLRLAGKLGQATGQEIELEWLYDFPCVVQLAARLEAQAGLPPAPRSGM